METIIVDGVRVAPCISPTSERARGTPKFNFFADEKLVLLRRRTTGRGLPYMMSAGESGNTLNLRTNPIIYCLHHPLSHAILFSIFDMFCHPVGWYSSVCCHIIGKTGTSHQKCNKTSQQRGWRTVVGEGREIPQTVLHAYRPRCLYNKKWTTYKLEVIYGSPEDWVSEWHPQNEVHSEVEEEERENNSDSDVSHVSHPQSEM